MSAAHTGNQRKKVLILASFFGIEQRDRWIDDFCKCTHLEFRKVPNPNIISSWHSRGARTPINEWLAYFRYASTALREDSDCVVASFPQLALMVATLLWLKRRSTTRLIAWNFNLGSLPGGLIRRIAAIFLRRVDRFIVHSRGEVETYARWLNLPREKFEFAPLQRGEIESLGPTPIPGPYIVSMGSANRDYKTLAAAVAETGIRTVIIAKKELLDSISDHENLVKLHGLSSKQCNDILGGGLINVVPIAATQTAAGQVTFTTSMRMGIATIATNCMGTIDYIRDGDTGILVPIGDPGMLSAAIVALWNDKSLRSRIASAGRAYADEHFSDEAAGTYLGQVTCDVLKIDSRTTSSIRDVSRPEIPDPV